MMIMMFVVSPNLRDFYFQKEDNINSFTDVHFDIENKWREKWDYKMKTCVSCVIWFYNRDFAFFEFERTKHQPCRNLRSY